jgi:hypothetical protein
MTEMPPPPPPPPMSSTPTVRIGDWFNEATDRLKPVWTEYLVAGLVTMIAMVVSALLCYIPYFIVGGPLVAGFFIYNARKMLGQPAEIGHLFKGFSKFSETLLLWLILVLPPVLVYLLAWLPGLLQSVGMGRVGEVLGGIAGCVGCIGIPLVGIIYPIVIGTLCVFAFPLVLFKNMDAVGALKKSIEVVKPNFMQFLLLWLACILVVFVAEIAGLIACVIGLFVTMPLAGAIIANIQLQAYRDFFGLSPDDVQQYN